MILEQKHLTALIELTDLQQVNLLLGSGKWSLLSISEHFGNNIYLLGSEKITFSPQEVVNPRLLFEQLL